MTDKIPRRKYEKRLTAEQMEYRLKNPSKYQVSHTPEQKEKKRNQALISYYSKIYSRGYADNFLEKMNVPQIIYGFNPKLILV